MEYLLSYKPHGYFLTCPQEQAQEDGLMCSHTCDTHSHMWPHCYVVSLTPLPVNPSGVRWSLFDGYVTIISHAAGCAWPWGTGMYLGLLQAKYRRKHLTVILLVSLKMPGAWVQMHSGIHSVILGFCRTRKAWPFTVNCFLYVSTLTLAPNQRSHHKVFDGHPRRFLESSSGPVPNPSRGNLYHAWGMFL